MPGPHTLSETERKIAEKIGKLPIDYQAMSVTSNLFRASIALRNQLERSVLAKHELSWTAFVVLWVVWIWEPVETRTIAEEGGFSKATLTGVMRTLESRGLLKRKPSQVDRRLVMVTLSPKGRKLMNTLFPEFNKGEQQAVSEIDRANLELFAGMLRTVTETAASGKLFTEN